MKQLCRSNRNLLLCISWLETSRCCSNLSSAADFQTTLPVCIPGWAVITAGNAHWMWHKPSEFSVKLETCMFPHELMQGSCHLWQWSCWTKWFGQLPLQHTRSLGVWSGKNSPLKVRDGKPRAARAAPAVSLLSKVFLFHPCINNWQYLGSPWEHQADFHRIRWDNWAHTERKHCQTKPQQLSRAVFAVKHFKCF